ncbi:pyruvate dehydrogenase complex E1 component subunit beta [Pseudobacteriovorax antillogorgiicola]|uniref:Pyruvate dehydrogenase E1 component beta subunit n=1 Tax=Pseudobacteriovorax antillogorgiicola TaxID=1513793 RepID=A0A1Y6CRY0_9BACT|nr:pyruvate dehydrogenase complex E1 component subunit beta [Pseudobacteriovorax antillogorgiicola]TCS41470.1 pyruvate dehydrogenase E1 component beta subunit [Pseudobacteriovorax antillogorgiicola]SMF83634.1 pyruvate dehydrogenase E1 component beta subunit [Pseudobacteriovorax antillogorgiicola]
MAQLTFREALGRAMKEEMERDETIFLMGEEVAQYDGAYKVSKGLLEKFGEKRVWDSPISEGGFAGLGIGAAMVGLRPIIEMMTWNFGIQAFDQIINHAAKMRYMSGGQFKVPIVFRGPNGAAHMLGAQHSQAVEPMITNIPGLIVVTCSTPYDGLGLLKSAIRDDNPVIFLESEMMYGLKGEVPDEEYLIPLGKGDIKKEGSDVTLIAWNKVVHKCMKIAEALEKDGVSVEVLDPRTLQPLDEDLIFESVKKTNRVVIVEEAWGFSSLGSQISDRIQSACFDYLDAPVTRVTNEFVPMPYNEAQEERTMPSEDRITQAIKDVMYL